MLGVILFTITAECTLQPLFPIVAIILIAAPLTALRDRADLERETVIDPLPLRCTGPLAPDSSTAQAAMPGVLAGRDRRCVPHPTERAATRHRVLARTVDERGG